MAATIWITQTLNEFGQALGFDELTLDERGTVQLDFEKMGVLGLECAGHSTLVFLKRTLAFPTADVYRRALEMCHYDEAPLDWLQAALLNNRDLVLATRIRHEDFQLSSLERVIATLGELHDTLAEAA